MTHELTMQLIFPKRNKPAMGEDINIQELLALCKSCGNVFYSSEERSKVKRHQLKRPA